ncbi:MAG: hypothetical protein ALAOOOJD_01462 [bacterium]|nr:hypothetical protein [bacterium]
MREAFTFPHQLVQPAVPRADPKYSGAVFVNCFNIIVAQRAGDIGIVLIMAESEGSAGVFTRNKFAEASSGADPKRAAAIDINCSNRIEAQIGMIVFILNEGWSFIVVIQDEFIKAVCRSDPKYVARSGILTNGSDGIAAQALRIIRVVFIINEFGASAGVFFMHQPIDSAAVGGNPKRAGLIFTYGRDIVVA